MNIPLPLPVSLGGTGQATALGTGVATALTVAVGSAGAVVLFNGAGGTPTSLVLTNATLLPIGGITGLGTGVATLLGQASSGTGGLAGLTSPTFVTPTLGAATATTLNKVTVTTPGTSATLTLITGSSLITAGAFALTLTSTATSNATIPAGTNTLYSTKAASITSAQLLASMSDPTGTGLSVFATSPTLTTPALGVATATSINKVTLTAPTTSATLTLVDGSSLITVGAFALTLTSSATSNATIPAGTNTLYSTKSASITSAQLLASMSDPTGTGLSVFGTTPTIATPVINGLATGTGVASAATVSTIATRDSSGNMNANNIFEAFTTTATAGGTTTLTIASTEIQVFTGTLTQIVKLPTTSVPAGGTYTIVNLSTGKVTVQSSGANAIIILDAGSSVVMTALIATPTTAANWTATYIGPTHRQNDTTNNLGIVGSRIETGWGVFAQGAASNKSETVTFGQAFATAPIVLIAGGGDQTGGSIAYGNGGNTEKGPITAKAYGMTTTAFTAHLHTSDGTSWSATANVYYQWIAIGS